MATAMGIFLIYNNAVPTLADIRTEPPHNDDIEKARKAAAVKSAGLVGLSFLIARDLNSFMISGLALIAMDYSVKHANGTHPATGKLDDDAVPVLGGDSTSNVYPMPDYADADADTM
jgi:hypothetical protein